MNDVIHAGTEALTGGAGRCSHPHWVLYYCTRGTGRFIFDDLEISYQAGNMIIIPAELPHAQEEEAGSSGLYMYIMHATLSFRYPMVLPDDENRSLQHIFEDAVYLFHHHPDLRESLLPAYGHLVAQHISVRRASSPRNLLVEEIAQTIMQNYPNPNFDLDGVLKSAPYCHDYLCRLFRQEMDTTPSKYLATLRLQTAADILRTGDGKSITEVARMCGYYDPLYFSRMFKKKYGMSPREYAKRPIAE